MTSNLTFSTAEFDALATGDPDTAAVGKLLAGLVSKRIVRLRAILNMTAEHAPGAHATLAAAYGVLAQSQTVDREAVRTVLTHPAVGAWIAECLRLMRCGPVSATALETAAGQFAPIAAAAAVRVGYPFTLKMRVRDGNIMVPGLGLATFPQCAADTIATLSFDRERLRFEASGDVVVVPASPVLDGDGWVAQPRLRSCAAGTIIEVDFNDIDPSRNGHGYALAQRSSRDIDAWQQALDEALRILATQYPRRAQALAAGLRSIVPLRERPGGDGASITARDCFGRIAMTPPHAGGRHLADTLIHEFHHSVLYALMDILCLHSAGPEAVHYSPWRDDPRPIDGLFHASYAYLGVVDFWRGQREVCSDRELLYADFEFARWRRQVTQAAQVLLRHGQLTKAGTVFVHGMAAAADRWLDLPVDEQAQRLADRMVTDHYTRWRLRHRHPDPVAVSAIAGAWRAGLPCPLDPATIRASVMATPSVNLALGERVRLCGLLLRDPTAFATAEGSPGNIAYVREDFDRALCEFRTAIAVDPTDIESWAGLALTLTALGADGGIPAAPEVAQAVYLEAARQTVPDIVAFERWMAAVPATAERTPV
jgi:HEXXH motif-containing protein